MDDIAVAADDQFMKEQYAYLRKKFGKITAQELPFTHCGCRNSRIKDGYKIDQQEFVDAMKTQTIGDIGDPERPLTKEETMQFRSVLGVLLWLCTTRLDLVADVGVLHAVQGYQGHCMVQANA